MRAELEEVVSTYRQRAKRPRVFLELADNPIMTVGGTSFVDELIRRAGGVNVAHELPQAYPKVNPEKVIEWDPEVILVCYMSRSGRAAEALANRIGWATITAVRSKQVFANVPNDLLLRPGPRLVEGVEALADLLYPPAAASHQAPQ